MVSALNGFATASSDMRTKCTHHTSKRAPGQPLRAILNHILTSVPWKINRVSSSERCGRQKKWKHDGISVPGARKVRRAAAREMPRPADTGDCSAGDTTCHYSRNNNTRHLLLKQKKLQLGYFNFSFQFSIILVFYNSKVSLVTISKESDITLTYYTALRSPCTDNNN